jgi:DNA ligase-1
MAWIDKSGSVTIRGRSGKPIDFNGIVEERLRQLLETSIGGVLDGELVVVEDNGKIMSRKKGNGILNKAIKGTIGDAQSSMVRFRVWDLIDSKAFKIGHDVMPYRLRLAMLKGYIDLQPSKYYELIESREVANIDEAREYFAKALARGEEGIMLKDMESPWEDKRSKYVLKFKSELDCDLEVIGWNQGTPGTKNEGKLGSLVCATSDRKVEVSISGFSDELREEITNNINDWIGKIVTVKYNERITSKEKGREDKDSLFLPRFLECRNDKDTADSSEKIL